jgi:hypothetical protein
MVNDEIDIDLSGVRDLFDNSIANKISSAIVVFFVVFMWFNSANLFANNDAIRSVIDGDTDWEVSFNESIITKTDSVIVADGDSEIILFDIPLSELDEGYRVGLFRITVTYSETSNIPGDPSDSVFATVIQNDIVAQWDDDNNTLSDSSNDGSQIDLNLLAYPDYDGVALNVSGYNEIQVLDSWVLNGHGLGEIEIEVGVETAAWPGTQDNNEEVTVTLEIVTFKALAIN